MERTFSTVLGIFLLCVLAQAKLESIQSAVRSPIEVLEEPFETYCGDNLFMDMVTPLNYPVTSHTTTTEDGYVLKLFRIQAKNTKMTTGKPVVFLQHGLFDSSDGWVSNTEPNSLGFVLANAGYDVWMGNSRGNKYSRINTKISPEDKEFWDYSFQEMGQYDVKANIKFVLDQTRQAKLTYVGHSQGTSQMFAALGDPVTAPYINSKVKKYIALAPIVYMTHVTSKLLRIVTSTDILLEGAKMFGVQEWLPGSCNTNSASTKFQVYACKLNPLLCNFALGLVDSNPRYDNQTRLPYFLEHSPSGSSLRTLWHYRQQIEAKSQTQFNKFDFGAAGNLNRYGQTTAPAYDLNNIKIPVRGFVGTQDVLGDVEDTSLLNSKLNQLKKDYKEYVYNNCGHMTFMWGLNPTQIFTDILAEIKFA